MLWIDVKYACFLNTQLTYFKVKNQNPFLANFRCNICGDSQKNKHKARAYLYARHNKIMFKCHNCNVGMSFSNYLKTTSPQLHDEWRMESFTANTPKPETKPNVNLMTFETPTFSHNKQSLLDKLLDNLASLPDDHIAVKYADGRRIPRDKFNEIYFIEDVTDIAQLSEKYKEKIERMEPRIIFPFYDLNSRLVGVTCRAIDPDSKIRYLTIRIKEDADLIYNLDSVDLSQDIYCVEGPIDSLFLPNAVAVGSMDVDRVLKYLPKNKVVLVLDNQPRNIHLIKMMKKIAGKSCRIVVWPDIMNAKDINQMIVDGVEAEDILQMIKDHTYQGLNLSAAIAEWAKV